jgi:hypothetical protein
VRVISALDEATVSDAMREYLADSLDIAFQQAQQVEALRQEVRTLEESWRFHPARWRYRSRKHRRAQQAHQFRAHQGPVWRCGQGDGSLLPAAGRPVPCEESR